MQDSVVVEQVANLVCELDHQVERPNRYVLLFLCYVSMFAMSVRSGM